MIKECNFRTNGAKGENIYCRFPRVTTDRSIQNCLCDGEDKCILYQIYNMHYGTEQTDYIYSTCTKNRDDMKPNKLPKEPPISTIYDDYGIKTRKNGTIRNPHRALRKIIKQIIEEEREK